MNKRRKPLPQPPSKPVEIVRVLRIVEYIGEREWVESTVTRSIHGTHIVGGPCGCNRICAATITEYPEILNQAKHIATILRPKAETQ